MRISTLLTPLALSFALICPAVADVAVGQLKLTNYWVRPGTAAKNTGAYVAIHNPNGTKDKLLKVECSDTNFTELHDHINENGIMKMRPVEAIAVETPIVELKRGSLHIMLMGLKKELKEGETVKMRLVFEKAGAVEVDFPVAANQPAPLTNNKPAPLTDNNPAPQPK